MAKKVEKPNSEETNGKQVAQPTPKKRPTSTTKPNRFAKPGTEVNK